MAEKVVIELEALTKEAIDEIKKLQKEVNKLNEEVNQGNSKTESGLKGVEQAGVATAASLRGIAIALKAAGIGLIISALNNLKDVFTSNQKVADAFSTTFEFVSIAFNDFVNFVVGNSSAVVNTFKAFFQDPLQGIKNFGRAIKDNVIERMNSALDTLGFLASAVKKVFAGDFAGALEDAKSAGKELVDVVTGVDDSFDKLTPVVSNYVAETVKAAQANVQLEKTANKAAVANQGLIEKYDLQAEAQRQIRDEERNTIEKRIEANEKLAEILDKQERQMRANAEAIVAQAQAQFDKVKNDENEIALMEAKNELAAVEAQIAGFRSEQLSNDLALNREKLELEQSISDAEAERAINEATFNAEQIENEYLRLQALRDVANQEKQIEETRLTEKMNSYKVGTQAFQDAQNELLQFQQENGQKQKQLERDINRAKQQEVTNALGNIAGIVGQNSKFGKAIAVVQAIRDTYTGANKALAQGGIFGFIGAAAVIAGGLANVKQITASQEPTAPSFARGGGSTPSVSTPTPSAPQPPAFNIVGAGAGNQLAETIAGQSQRPIKAFVTSQDVTTAQSLERNIVEGASI